LRLKGDSPRRCRQNLKMKPVNALLLIDKTHKKKQNNPNEYKNVYLPFIFLQKKK